MARLIDLGGEPVNQSEREIVQILVQELPKDWAVIPNASLPDANTGHAYEYDAIVVAAHAVYVVEVKGWRGVISQISQSDWQLESGRIERNPLLLADLKAKVLASVLKQARLYNRKPPYVQACLVCGGDRTRFDVWGQDGKRCLRGSEVLRYLRDPRQLQVRGQPENYRPVLDNLVQVITGPLEARRQAGRLYGSYKATDLQHRDEERAIWLGRHSLLDDDRLVRIRAWYLSSYRYSEKQRQDELSRLMRSAEALSKVGDHPRIATLRDFGEHDGEFYEVSDWSESGTLATAFARGALARLPSDRVLQVLWDIAAGLEAARKEGVFHRSLSPAAVLFDASGRARLTDFDLAFVEGAKGTVYGTQPLTQPEFVPPELRDVTDYDVFDSTDLYSLGKMALYLFGDRLPETVRPIIERCTNDDPLERPEYPGVLTEEIERIRRATSRDESSRVPEEAKGMESFSPGDVIDGVNTVLGEVGRGAGSVVYRVASEPLNAELALKLIVDPPRGYDAAAEYKLLRTVDSPHVPRAHWIGRIERPDGPSIPYLLLDLVEGKRLSTLIRSGPVEVEDAIRWADDLLDALDALHTAGATGVLHRDVKSDNIVIGPQGAVLVDFGSAREGSDAGFAPEGTLRTSPPDLATTGWEPQADVFSAACVTYEMFTGRAPWTSSPSSGELPAPAVVHRPEVPKAVSEVLERALRPLAKDRFPDAGSLRVALAKSGEEEQAEPSPDSKGTRTTLAAVVDEAGEALWTSARVTKLARHPDLVVAICDALNDCIVRWEDGSVDAARHAFLESEARAAAFEAPVPEAMPRAYDLIGGGLRPSIINNELPEESTSGLVNAEPTDSCVWFDELHFTEWAWITEAAETFERPVNRWAWTKPVASAGRGPSEVEVFESMPTETSAVSLPGGDRAAFEIGTLAKERRRLIEDALLPALESRSVVWVGYSTGLVYLGHGLRRDVGDGLGDESDVARAVWAAAFGDERFAPDGEPLPCRLPSPTRSWNGTRYPVGRVAWPDPPSAPWLRSGGLSFPERALVLFRLGTGKSNG